MPASEPEPYIPSAPRSAAAAAITAPPGYVQMSAPDGTVILVPQHLVHMYGVQPTDAAGGSGGWWWRWRLLLDRAHRWLVVD